MNYNQNFNINFEYDVHFTHHLFASDNQLLRKILCNKSSKAIVFIDDNVDTAFPHLRNDIINWSADNADVLKIIPPIHLVEGGEKIKANLACIENIGREIVHAGICRHSFVIIIGGGAVLDAVGFAASVIHRGIKQIRIPTTVLSQNDSGVGVKNGINFEGIKNMFGCFCPPYAVINDSLFLTTLEKRDILSGIAEAFKVAIIKDAEFYSFLKKNATLIKNKDLMVVEEVIKKCAKLHLDHIKYSNDPFEKGNSRPLDFGHWSAHRLETLSNNDLRHGEAVAIGIALDSFSAAQLGLIDQETAEDICHSLINCGFELYHESLDRLNKDGEPELLKGLKDFQEHLGGDLTLAMPNAIGELTEINILPEEVILESIRKLKISVYS